MNTQCTSTSGSLSATEQRRACPSCCLSCNLNLGTAAPSPPTADPFSPQNLLAAGTIRVDDAQISVPCDHRHSLDAWHFLPVRELSHRPDDTLFCGLGFLAEHSYLRATCRFGVGGTTLFVRVYLVPYDLRDVQGKLRNRSEGVVKTAKYHLQALLPQIRQDLESWNAQEPTACSPCPSFVSQDTDNRTMSEIYNDLPSPTVHCSLPFDDACTPSSVTPGGDGMGLRTILYDYQRHAVEVMMKREHNSRPGGNPLFISVRSVYGEEFFIQPSTLEIVRERPMVTRSRGGILCEELGTGKTLMILALILATIEQLPDPEESLLDSRPVMTPLAYRNFTSSEYIAARERAGEKAHACNDVQQIPSLVDLLIHHICISRDGLGVRRYEDQLEASALWRQLQDNTPFYHHYDTDISSASRSRRRPVKRRPRVVYLTRATLIVVPLNLLGQWDHEVLKHCHSSIRYLIVRTSTKLPTVKALASEYDLIIMSDSRFRQEAEKNNVDQLYERKKCSCPVIPNTRIPDCSCQDHPEVTPLLQIRWKRLVIDEGHVSANITGTMNSFVREMSIERKWIVTGTPTSNILGLSLGHQNDDSDTDADAVGPLHSEPKDAMFEASTLVVDGSIPVQRIWTNYDRKNLQKLGNMIGDFLAVPQFKSEAKSFGTHVISPLCDRKGPRLGAVKVLGQVMEMVMVRHRIEDVEQDVKLEPMTHKIVYMDLDEFALKSYNAMQAGIAINAIDSQRRDQDYIFHSTKTKELQNVVDNMSQGMFWSASSILYNVDQMCEEADEFLTHAVERQVPESDMELLKQALTHARAAAEDTLWRAMQYHEDVPFRVSGMDAKVFEAWTRGRLGHSSRSVDLMHANRLVELRANVRKRPFASSDFLAAKGNAVNEGEKLRCGKSAQSTEIASVARTKKMISEVKGELEILRQKARFAEEVDDEDHTCAPPITAPIPQGTATSSGLQTLNSSPLSRVRVGCSLSTKLDYILNEVLQHSHTEKFLIFSKSPLTLAHVAEALSLIEVKHLRYTTDVTQAVREQFVMTFESSDTFRVFLMDLKLGARGLNLVSASRVIFCEPVWEPDVESQAIKRAHRIGQTKPITVKTLVIRSTAEEAMIARRQHLNGSTDKIPSMTTEIGMRHFIENPRFLIQSAAPGSVVSFDLPLLNPVPTKVLADEEATTGTISVTATEPSYDSADHASEPAPKKVKGVRFADEPSGDIQHPSSSFAPSSNATPGTSSSGKTGIVLRYNPRNPAFTIAKRKVGN
ncbi:hypothetical protein BV22DRAFT_1038738 [Leucogyrophana mollusca]|uniref:Uncharacterized protein n=1 Tax=Leucogyrophana mollusca TaxID=85980 RepID=A0ACB8B7E9_9AGAM|nr:hypothetical protein BV22DRAFT_1038738 [Leucogyrophana mollusca]